MPTASTYLSQLALEVQTRLRSLDLHSDGLEHINKSHPILLHHNLTASRRPRFCRVRRRRTST